MERIHTCGRGWEGRATVGMGDRADRSGWSGGCVAGHVVCCIWPGTAMIDQAHVEGEPVPQANLCVHSCTYSYLFITPPADLKPSMHTITWLFSPTLFDTPQLPAEV